MNIIEATKAMNEGKKLRMHDWGINDYITIEGYRIITHPKGAFVNDKYNASVDDILSNDWELYEEPKLPIELAWQEVSDQMKANSEFRVLAEGRHLFELTWNAAKKYFENQKS